MNKTINRHVFIDAGDVVIMHVNESQGTLAEERDKRREAEARLEDALYREKQALGEAELAKRDRDESHEAKCRCAKERDLYKRLRDDAVAERNKARGGLKFKELQERNDCQRRQLASISDERVEALSRARGLKADLEAAQALLDKVANFVMSYHTEVKQ